MGRDGEGARARAGGGARLIALLHRAPAYGAVERYVEAVARALGDRAVLIHPGIEEFERLGVRTIVLQEPSARALVRLLRSLRPDVAHVTDVWPQALLAARLARIPRVLVTHHTPELERRDNLAGRVWWLLGWSTRPEVVYTSEADRTRDGRRPSHVVPLGIELERFAGGRPAFAKDGPLVGIVARLAPQKDHATFLEAARLVVQRRPDVRFAIVGDGELRQTLERRARELKVDDRVLFTGRRDDVPDVLASLDVFALPSLYEGLCLSVIEAQAAGVPVVATPVGGIRETVIDGQSGLLVPTRDPRALADAIVRLLNHPEAAARLTAEAQTRVRDRYSVDRMLKETFELYGLPNNSGANDSL